MPTFVCQSCGDHFKVVHCKRCNRLIIDRCGCCHREKVHGIIVPQYMRPQFGGGSAGPRDDDANGGLSNARRALEEHN